MPSKFPCCTDCGTKLSFVISNIRSPNEHRVSFYYCKKCESDTIIIRKQLTGTAKRYEEKKIQFILSHLKR